MSKTNLTTDFSKVTRQSDLIEQCLDHVFHDVTGSKWTLLDFPAHANVGDSAIWLGTLRFLKSRFRSAPAFVSRNKEFPKNIEQIAPNGPILLHGGGNFGDLWDGFWQNRVGILTQFPNRKIVQMPQ